MNTFRKQFSALAVVLTILLALLPLQQAAAAHLPDSTVAPPATPPAHVARHAATRAVVARHAAAKSVRALALPGFTPAHHSITLAHHNVTVHGRVGDAHRFSPTFVQGMRANMLRSGPKVNPERGIDCGKVISVGRNQIVVRREMPFHVAHAPSHSRKLFTLSGLGAAIEHVSLSAHTLLTLPGRDGRAQRLHGTTHGLPIGATVVIVGAVAGDHMSAQVVADLAASKVRQITPAALRHARVHTQRFVTHPNSGWPHRNVRPLDATSDQTQNGTFTGCFPSPYCIINQYTNITDVFTPPNQEDQGGLTIYDDGTTKIFLQSVGYAINADDFSYNWPMVFKATAPTTMYQAEQQAIDLSVAPQGITLGQYSFEGGLGISYGATFNVTVAGYSTQAQVGAGYGVINTTADPAPLAGSTLDVPAAQCYAITGFDFKGASLAGVNLCFDISLEGANVGTRFTPTGAHFVNAVGNPVASPAAGSLSATPEPLWIVPDQKNWSLGLDNFYWAPQMTLSGYIQFQATIGAGPAALSCTCTTWNTPALTFPGYPTPMPMIDTDPNNAASHQCFTGTPSSANCIELGDPVNGPQTSSISYSYTSDPAPTVTTYTGATDFSTGNFLGVSGQVSDSAGDPMVNYPVTFSLYGDNTETCTGTTDALGDASCDINIMGVAPGHHLIATQFAGDSQHASSYATSPVQLNATGLQLKYFGLTSDGYGGEPYFGVDVTALNGTLNSQTPDIATIQVAFSSGGQPLCTANLDPTAQDALGSFQAACGSQTNYFAELHPGQYTITASIVPSVYFTGDPITFAYNVTKDDTSLSTFFATSSITDASSTGKSAPYHDQVLFAATLHGPGFIGGFADNQRVTFMLGTGNAAESCVGTSQGYGTVQCLVNSINLVPGDYPLTVNFPGNTDFNPSSISLTFTVTKGTSSLTYTGPSTAAYHSQSVPMSATLAQPGSGVAVVGQVVHFALGSQSCDATTDIHGNAACQLDQINQDPGATLTVSYAGGPRYEATSITPTFTITPIASALSYTGPSMVTYHNTVHLSATLTEVGSGLAIANQSVHFTLGSGENSQSCDAATDSNGNASCAINSVDSTGTTFVLVQFAGNADYLPSAGGNGSFTVNPEGVHLSYTGAASQDFHDGVTLSAVLNEAPDGSGPGIQYQSITFTLGSQSCTAGTDANGNASCSMASLTGAPGAINVAVSYPGNADYNPAAINSPFQLNQEETSVSYTGSVQPVATGQSVTLSAALIDSANPAEGENASSPIAGEPITLSLGTQSCTGMTANDGTVSCTIASLNQPGGYQTVGVRFAGDSSYLPSGDASQKMLVYSTLSSGGGFLLGDQSVAAASASTPLTFWGSQWSSLNSLSGGAAPTSFKGFSSSFGSGATPACGATWSSSGGNSAGAPASLPAYMAVAVTSNATKTGSTISGTVTKVVIVKTNSGYGPNPGQTGTGTVVATICGN